MKKLFLLFAVTLILGCENEVDPTPNFNAKENLNGRWQIVGLSENNEVFMYEVQLTTNVNSLKIDSVNFVGKAPDVPVMFGTFFGEYANNWFKGSATRDSLKFAISVLVQNTERDLDFQVEKVTASGEKKHVYYSGIKKK